MGGAAVCNRTRNGYSMHTQTQAHTVQAHTCVYAMMLVAECNLSGPSLPLIFVSTNNLLVNENQSAKQ